MKQLNERFSEETRRQMMGLYFFDGSDWLSFVPSENHLTVDNFGLMEDGIIYTAEDFRWYEENGGDRDLVYDDSGCYFDGDDLPDEVFCLLNTVICLKFAKQHMAVAKAMLDTTDDDKAKQAMNKAFIEFENLDDDTESAKKLQIARDALNEVSDVFEDAELANTFYNAFEVIDEVIDDLAQRSDRF